MKKMRRFTWAFLVIVLCAMSLNVASAEKKDVEGLIEGLSDDDFDVRVQSFKELKEVKLDLAVLEKLLKKAKTPEARFRIKRLIGLQMAFVAFKGKDKLPKNALPQGRESDGTPLYLIRSLYKGETYVGKFNPQHECAYIPVGDKEVSIPPAAEVFVLKGKWLSMEDSKEPLVVGKTSDGKKIFAIRAELGQLNGPVIGGKEMWQQARPLEFVRKQVPQIANRVWHMGMLIEGEKEGKVPYGGKAISVKRFQILQDE